ncbi:hypothetical protein CesoFtcFv8_021314 [Champsocephalus esox]|uniref:Uncharacterized protein n=1 Tax=Champsocephalus esox TaxID=159716 RepID=A0AAN8BCP1_9TELE|nr:hypothetical protein CesoFtcFv8_021314 [Champsocephalus esox]
MLVNVLIRSIRRDGAEVFEGLVLSHLERIQTPIPSHNLFKALQTWESQRRLGGLQASEFPTEDVVSESQCIAV